MINTTALIQRAFLLVDECSDIDPFFGGESALKLSKYDSVLSTLIGGNVVTFLQNVVRIDQSAQLVIGEDPVMLRYWFPFGGESALKLSKDDSALSTPIDGNVITFLQNVVGIEQSAQLEGKYPLTTQSCKRSRDSILPAREGERGIAL